MNLNNLPPLQRRHFTSPKNLTREDREANFRDFQKLQQFVREQASKKKRRSTLYRDIISLDKITLEYFANEGSSTARRLCDVQEHLTKASANISGLTHVDSLIYELANACRKSECIIGVPIQKLLKLETVKIMIYDKFEALPEFEKSQIDVDTRICYSELVTGVKKVTFLKECIEKYPEEIFFRISLFQTKQKNYDPEKVIQDIDATLEVFPNNRTLLHYKAALCSLVGSYKESVDTFIKIIEVAPCDYEYLPELYYEVAHRLNKLGNNLTEVEKYYRWGLEAENERLPILPPLQYQIKEALDKLFQRHRPGEALIKAQYQFQGNKGREMYKLLNAYRVKLIRRYREAVTKQAFTINEPKGLKVKNRKLLPLKEIKFLTINEICDEIFEKKKGRSKLGLKCFVVEEALVWGSHITFMAEDEDEEIFVVYVKSESEEFAKKITFAGKIRLLNPYVWRTKNHGQTFIEIWIGFEDQVIFASRRKSKFCRFCWKKGDVKKCANCKKCFYCSKECQKMDWVILKHEIVCKN